MADIGKLRVQTRDTAGFIVNRLLVSYLLDSGQQPVPNPGL